MNALLLLGLTLREFLGCLWGLLLHVAEDYARLLRHDGLTAFLLALFALFSVWFFWAVWHINDRYRGGR